MKRKPCVSGQFYPASQKELLETIRSLCKKEEVKKKVKGVILPHAGYIFSGKVAGLTLSKVTIPQRVILIGPNHTGRGEVFSLWEGDNWITPLGEVKIDQELRNLLLKNSNILKLDSLAHEFEHCLEVILPFLQYFNPQIKLTPIVIGGGTPNEWEELAKSLFKSVRELEEEVLLIASSDFSHYEPDVTARKKDDLAIQAILRLDKTEFFKKVIQEDMTICGYMPIIVLLNYCELCGCKSAELISYMTSADVTGDRDSVVGYAGIIFY